MVKMSTGAADLNLPAAGSAKTNNDTKGVSDDFKKLLQGKQESSDSKANQEVSKSTKPETQKTEVPGDSKEETKETDDSLQTQELLVAYQMSQGIRPELIQAEDITADMSAAGTVATETEGILTEEEGLQMQMPVQEQASEVQIPVVETPQSTEKGSETGEPVAEQVPVLSEEAGPMVAEPQKEAQQSQILSENEQVVQTPHAQKKEVKAAPEAAETTQADNTDIVAEQAVSAAALPADSAEAVEAQPEQPVRVHVQQPEELPEKVTDQLLAKMADGVKEFEIHIEPEHLGKIAVKILYADGQANISIFCSEKHALDVLGNNAREIGNVIARNFGGETTIIVEKQETDYLHQHQEENQQGGQEERQGQQKGGEKKQTQEDAEQFLQKLRLGLTG